jgi:hypothetical protein
MLLFFSGKGVSAIQFHFGITQKFDENNIFSLFFEDTGKNFHQTSQ